MSNAPHILVIDDEPQILRAIRTILTEKQFRVTTASRGEEGLTLAATNQPDLIILDLGLPDMDGVEVCTRLREWTQTPIIILSVRDSERDKVAALDMGVDVKRLPHAAERFVELPAAIRDPGLGEKDLRRGLAARARSLRGDLGPVEPGLGTVVMEMILRADRGDSGVGQREVRIERDRVLEHLQSKLKILPRHPSGVVPSPQVHVVRLQVFGGPGGNGLLLLR